MVLPHCKKHMLTLLLCSFHISSFSLKNLVGLCTDFDGVRNTFLASTSIGVGKPLMPTSNGGDFRLNSDSQYVRVGVGRKVGVGTGSKKMKKINKCRRMDLFFLLSLQRQREVLRWMKISSSLAKKTKNWRSLVFVWLIVLCLQPKTRIFFVFKKKMAVNQRRMKTTKNEEGKD